jgi:peptidyl-tRNA hydrolase, PTH2 family
MKQVIVVNEALKLPRGKLAAQVAHAAVAAFLEASGQAQQRWLAQGMPKVVVRCESEAELLALQAHAQRERLPVAPIHDAGHTVVEAGTLTCIGFGPAEREQLDAITGALKLVR